MNLFMAKQPTSIALYTSNQTDELALIYDMLHEIITLHDKSIQSSINYGIPFYKNSKGKALCYMMTTKSKEVALTFWNGAFMLEEFPELDKGSRKLMASLYYKTPETIDIHLIKKIINKVMNNQDKVDIKPIAISDSKELKAIEVMADKIWKSHYTPIIGANQVEYMLEKFQSVKAMSQQIKEGYLYFTIALQDEFAGYFSIQKRKESLFLSKVYIDEQFRGKKLFDKVLKFIIDFAVEHQLKTIELTVNKYNTNSIEIYQSKGFKITQEAVFEIGNNYVMDDYVMNFDI